MDPLTASALLGVGSQIGGGIFGYIGQREANRTNLRLAKEARDHDVKMWQMQNEYNTPAMQMQRLKEAGLNAHLIYGQGTPGNATSPQKAPVPEVTNELTSLAHMSLAPVLSMYQDWRVKEAQIENLKANAKATMQNATLTALKQITQDYTNKKLGIQLPWINLQEKYKTNISRYKADQENVRSQYLYKTLPEMTKQVMLRNNLLEQQTRAIQLENQFNQELKPYGIRSTDPLLMRLIMHVLPKNLLNNMSNFITKKFSK